MFNWKTKKKPTLFKVIEPSSVPYRTPSVCHGVECLIGKQNKPNLFKVTEPSSVPYRTPSACAKWAANPDPPPVIPVPESIDAQAAYQMRYENTESCVECFNLEVNWKTKKPTLFNVTEPSSVPCVLSVCFFVLCNRHCFNKALGPGRIPGDRAGGYLSTLHHYPPYFNKIQ